MALLNSAYGVRFLHMFRTVVQDDRKEKSTLTLLYERRELKEEWGMIATIFFLHEQYQKLRQGQR